MRHIKLLAVMAILVALPACATVRSAIETALTGNQPSSDNSTAVSSQNNYTGSILVKGLQRPYAVHLPASYDKSRKWPLIIALHGGGSEGGAMNALTDFNTLADRQGFIIVYPEGFEHNWNDGRDAKNIKAQAQNIDDVYYISSLIDRLAYDLSIDSKMVYATGISNGAMMSHRLGCELSDKIAAIAPVAGSIPQKMAAVWSSERPVPVLIINGTEDALVPYNGGDVSFLSLKRGKVISVADTVKFWVTQNGCAANPETTRLPHLNQSDITWTIIDRYSGCREGADVVLYTVHDGGHTWPGGLQYMSEKVIGKTSRDFNATEVIWEFFKQHSMK